MNFMEWNGMFIKRSERLHWIQSISIKHRMVWMKFDELNAVNGVAAAAIQFHYTKWMKVEWNGEAGETEWFIQFNRSINSTRWNWIDGGLKWIEHEVNVNASIQPHSFQLIEWIVWLNWIDIITVNILYHKTILKIKI